MPIIYVHGVNTRTTDHFVPIKAYLQRIVAPAIAKDPENVAITAADSFSLCKAPKWEGISRPRSALLAQGAGDVTTPERNMLLDAIVQKMPSSAVPSPSGFTSGQTAAPVASIKVDELSEADFADLIALAMPSPGAGPVSRARIGIAADEIAHDAAFREKVKNAANSDEQLQIIADAVAKSVEAQSGMRAAGPIDFFRDIKDRINESMSRLSSSPGAAASLVAGEFRGSLNDFVTRFIGDLLYYISGRGTAAQPGPIPAVLVNAIKTAQQNKQNRNGEPILVLTHSMGGQIAYDTVTSFLPGSLDCRDIKVDFWCATASQVGFFEELNMFLASSAANSKQTGRKAPFPSATLGHWWNVWDHNDILSFTTQGDLRWRRRRRILDRHVARRRPQRLSRATELLSRATRPTDSGVPRPGKVTCRSSRTPRSRDFG